jgi:hypothetical protein
MDWTQFSKEIRLWHVNNQLVFAQKMVDKYLQDEQEVRNKYEKDSFMWSYIRWYKTQRKKWQAELKYWQEQLDKLK